MQKEPSALKNNLGDFSPKLVQLTDEVLFGASGSVRNYRSATAAWSPCPPWSPAAAPSSSRST
jgi:hypothetical protein